MQLGVIADDFTGATDIASFLVRNGMPTVQLNGVPTRDLPLTSEAVVISLKTRSCPAEMAVSQSLAALSWLRGPGAVSSFISSTVPLSTAPRRATLARCWMPCWPSWVRRGR